MRVREATGADRAGWDAFVDEEGGGFFHYFDWKQVHEAGGRRFIPLVVESGTSQLAGILPVVKEQRRFYSTLVSGKAAGVEGLLLKKDLPENERNEATAALLEHVDRHLSRGCSSFRLTETLSPDTRLSDKPTSAVLGCGFRYRYEAQTRLPCNFVLEIGAPFEEKVWRLWSRMIRQGVKKAEENGIVVVQDRELRYAGAFVDMLYDNYARHHTDPPSRDEIRARLRVFRDRSKMFVALLDGRPVVTLLCHYGRSTCYLAKMGTHEKDTDDANKLCWKVAIEDACASGCRYADLGATTTEGLAFLKERFRATRVPMRVYEKRYSATRSILEKSPVLLSNAWHDKGYVWRNRRVIWDRITHS